MSSKSQITTSINTINDGGNNTASEVRAVYETFNDEFFPIVDTYTGTNNSGVFFQFDFAKSGNTVCLNIVIRNTTTLTVGPQSFLFFGPFLVPVPNKYFTLFLSNGQMYRAGASALNIQVSALGISISSNIPPSSEEYRGVITYIANND